MAYISMVSVVVITGHIVVLSSGMMRCCRVQWTDDSNTPVESGAFYTQAQLHWLRLMAYHNIASGDHTNTEIKITSYSGKQARVSGRKIMGFKID
uniref:Uncharacterized protein n=1 Tax=Strigamia maritima TaxID=126957 RepID=T1JLV6_STRMM